MNTPLFLLRAFQMGLHVADLEELDEGVVTDMAIEAANDHAEYAIKPTQATYDRF
jgi:hypothetical protein